MSVDLKIKGDKSFDSFLQNKHFKDMFDGLESKVKNIEDKIKLDRVHKLQQTDFDENKRHLLSDLQNKIELLENRVKEVESKPPLREYYIREEFDIITVSKKAAAQVAVSILLAFILNKALESRK